MKDPPTINPVRSKSNLKGKTFMSGEYSSITTAKKKRDPTVANTAAKITSIKLKLDSAAPGGALLSPIGGSLVRKSLGGLKTTSKMTLSK